MHVFFTQKMMSQFILYLRALGKSSKGVNKNTVSPMLTQGETVYGIRNSSDLSASQRFTHLLQEEG